MSGMTEEQRRAAVEQMLANWRIEGFQPDAAYLARLDRWVAGEITLREAGFQIDERFGKSE